MLAATSLGAQTDQNIGFSIKVVERPSNAWDGGGFKPIYAWHWYPVGKLDHAKPMKYGEYVEHINPTKQEASNRSTYYRIANGLTQDSLSQEVVGNYLNQPITGVFSGGQPLNNRPVLVLSGANPIYFTALAEKLAKAGYYVVAVPRTGIREGERLPFTAEGVGEYQGDLNAVLDFIQEQELADVGQLTFVSWSFEGVATLPIAIKRGAVAFISLDAAVGYDYAIGLIGPQTMQASWPFVMAHYTGSNSDYGKNLDLLKQYPQQVCIYRDFDLDHAAFTSLHALTLPDMLGHEISTTYQDLFNHLMVQLSR